MSRFANTFSGPSGKRSSSLNEYSSRGHIRIIPCQQFPNQSQTLNESFNQPHGHSFFTDTNYNSQSGSRIAKFDQESVLPPHEEVEKLNYINGELRKENKALTNKLIENSTFQQKICQLEAQNKQLMKELNRKDDLLRSSSQEGSPIKPSLSQRGGHSQGYAEIMAQNKILADEVAWLKRQLDGAIYEKSTVETKSYELQKLEAKLEEANSQIELLKQDLVKKNFEIEELYDRATKLKVERDQAHLCSQENSRSLAIVQDQIRASEARKSFRSSDFEDEKARLIGSYSLEISKLREELANTHARQEQMTRRAQIAEEDLHILREKIVNRECEYDRLRESFVNIDEEKEKEIRIREKELERIIKSKTNEGIKQMLQEKLHYEERIGYLEDKIKSLEAKNTEARTKSDDEWRQMELKYRNLLEQYELSKGGEPFEEERLRKEVFVLHERLVEAEESLKESKHEQVKAYSLLASQEKEAVKLQKELEDLGSEITIYQERMKNLEKQYQQEKEDLKRREKGHLEVLEKMEILKKRLYEQEIRGEEERNHQREALEKVSKQLKETKEIISELNIAKTSLEEDNELLLSKATDYKRRLEESEAQLTSTAKESDKLRIMYADAAKQLDSARQHRGELVREYSFQQHEDLKREHNNIKEKDLDLREATIKFNAERRWYEGEMKQLRVLKESAEEQVEKLYDLLGQRKQECEAYLLENEQLWNETERLRSLLQNPNGPTEAELHKERSKLELERLNKGLEELNIELSRRIDGLSD